MGKKSAPISGIVYLFEKNRPRRTHFAKTTAVRYILAVLAAIAAILLREALDPVFHARYAYHTIWLAVIFSAWYCGVGPSIVAVAIDTVGVWYLYLTPERSFVGKDRVEIMGILVFLAFSAITIALGESNRRLILKRQQAEEELLDAHAQLEDRVRERTAALQHAQAAARRLSARILSLQDRERRRFARELHDSLGQYLAALKINLDVFASMGSEESALARECSAIVQRCLVETRTISHLLHPPLLDESGFASAAQWYVDGFARRSGIHVELDLPHDRVRLDRDTETTLFRTLQEALTNVHRHSGATWVHIRMEVAAAQIRLSVADNGTGMSDRQLERVLNSPAEAGVGIAGLHERVRELGGSLEIQSNSAGTILQITTPFVVRLETEDESTPTEENYDSAEIARPPD